MSALGLALAGVLTITLPIGAQANGAVANMRPGPASNTVLVWGGGSSGGHSGAIGDHPAASRIPQWKGGGVPPHWGPNRYYGGCSFYSGPSAPTYWFWVPGSAVFDYPFPDWRGPTDGWGNP
jgi:hypothetical protein